MSRIKRIKKFSAVLFFILLPALIGMPGIYPRPFGAGVVRAAEHLPDELTAEELKSGRYFYMIDEQGWTVLVTGRRLGIGDRFLNTENNLYEVESVEGYLARARFVKKVKLKTGAGYSAKAAAVWPVEKQIKPAYRIAIYHSHNAESYVPSDGTDSVYGVGGIHDVGLAFKESLERKGVNVLYSDQLHLPHDRGAYRRSRVTALRLIRERPDAIFDLHRDAAPWEKYALELNGENVTQIQIVVGLSNPGAAANEQFAYDLKGYADRIYPGLVHGVLLIWGSYNQDISPLALLLEVGAHTNTKEAARRGIARFAGVVSYYFYGPAFLKDKNIAIGPRAPETAPANRPRYGIMRAFSGSVLSLLFTATGAALGFYFLNNPAALADLFLWWEDLPGKAAALERWVRGYRRSLPLLLKRIRRAAPFNLRQAWQELCREGPAVPRLFRKLGSRMLLFGKRIMQAAAVRWKEAPQNLQRAWQRLRREGRELPGLLRNRIFDLKEAAAALGDRFSGYRREFETRLGQARAEAKAEAGFLFGKLREYMLRLGHRLRP